MPWPEEYPVGTAVRVLSNEGRNKTLHWGTVRRAVWHQKDECWNYYLEVGGKKISKRYLAEDLESLEEGPQL